MTAVRPAESEALILGALLDADGALLKSNAADLVEQSGLGPEDFADARARLCFQALTRLAEHNRPVDATTVFMAGKTTGRLDDGALSWLQALQARNTLDRVHFGQVTESFRSASRGHSVATQLERLCRALRAREQGPGQVSAQLEALAAQLTAQWAPDQTADADLVEVFAEWNYAGQSGGRALSVPTGIRVLDEAMGGWAPNLNLVIGQPSVGKSAIIASVIEAQLRAGMNIGLFGLEDGTRWLARRLAAKGMGMPVRDVGRQPMTAEQADRAADVGGDLGQLMSRLTVFRFNSIGVLELCRRASSWVKSRGVQCIYIDHGGLIHHQFAKGQDNRLAVGETLQRIRAVAERHNVPMVVLMHTARPDPSQRNAERPPAMTEIAESAYAERHAFKILGLWKKGPALRATVLKDKEGEANVTLELQRLAEQALVGLEGGHVVNLGQERREERESYAAQREEDAKRRREARWKEQQERKAQAAAEKKAKEPAQQSLLPEPKR